MSISNLNGQINTLNGDIATLNAQIGRLQVAESEAIELYYNILTYKRAVTQHKNSINVTFGSFTWEGQTVTDFKNLYSNATNELDSQIITQYLRILDGIQQGIRSRQYSVELKQREISALWTQIRRLQQAQSTR